MIPFIGLAILLYFAIQEHPALFPRGTGAPSDKPVLLGTIAFCAICFLNSTIYHTFMSHSERAYGWLLRLDYCGINGVIVACTVGGVYFGYRVLAAPFPLVLALVTHALAHFLFPVASYYCFPEWKLVYIVIPILLGSAVMILDIYPLLSGSQSVTQMHNVHILRVFLFTSMVGFGLVPLFHWVYLNGYSSTGTSSHSI